jgi:hypothetical protein
MFARSIVADLVDEGESRLRFGKKESGGDVAFFGRRKDHVDLLRIIFTAAKREMVVPGCLDFKRDYSARREVFIFSRDKFDGCNAVPELVFADRFELPIQLRG